MLVKRVILPPWGGVFLNVTTMKVQIETKFNIGDKVKFIHSNKLWLGTIASISIDSAIMEEVAGNPVDDSDIRYAIKVQFSENGENYEKEYGTFRAQRNSYCHKRKRF